MLLATGTLDVLSFIVFVKPLISLISPEEFALNKVYYIVNDRNIEQDLWRVWFSCSLLRYAVEVATTSYFIKIMLVKEWRFVSVRKWRKVDLRVYLHLRSVRSLSSMIKIHSFFLNESIFMNFKFNFLTSTNSLPLQQSNIAKEYRYTNFHYRNFYSFYFF